MSLTSPELTLIQQRIQNVLADMSLIISEPASAENAQLNADSWNRVLFLERVHSYKPTTWFAKPAWMSPVACARYGWKNIELDLLQCVSCKSLLVGRLPTSFDPSVYEACRRRLEDQIQKTGHHPCCSWPGKPTPMSLFEVDGRNESSDAVVEKMMSRVSALSKLGNELPVVDLSLLSLCESDVNSVINILAQKNSLLFDSVEPRAVLESACVLALCGWETSELSSSSCPQVHCEICNRCNGMWNFITHRSQQEDETRALLADDLDADEESLRRDEEDVGRDERIAVDVSNCSAAGSTMEANNTDVLPHDEPDTRVADKADSTSPVSESSSDVAESSQISKGPIGKAIDEVDVERSEPANRASAVDANSHAVSEAAGLVLRKSSDVADAVLCTAGSESSSAKDSTTLEAAAFVEDVVPSNLKTLTDDSGSPKQCHAADRHVLSVDGGSVVNDLLQGSDGTPVSPDRSAIKSSSSRLTGDSAIETVMHSECVISDVFDKACRDGSGDASVTHDNFGDTVRDCRSVRHENSVLHSDDEEITENRQEVSQPCADSSAGAGNSLVDNCTNNACGASSDVSRTDDKNNEPAECLQHKSEREDFYNCQTADVINMTEQQSLHQYGEACIRLADVEDVESPCTFKHSTGQLDATETLQSDVESLRTGTRTTSLKRPASPLDNERGACAVVKHRRLTSNVRRKTVFNPVAEHRPWCPWVTSTAAVSSESEHKPWRRLLHNLLTDDPNTLASAETGSTPEGLECIRNLFRSWTSPVVSH